MRLCSSKLVRLLCESMHAATRISWKKTENDQDVNGRAAHAKIDGWRDSSRVGYKYQNPVALCLEHVPAAEVFADWVYDCWRRCVCVCVCVTMNRMVCTSV